MSAHLPFSKAWVNERIRLGLDALCVGVGKTIGKDRAATKAALAQRDAKIKRLEARILKIEKAMK